jgi:DNA-binding NtrC family response regulator
MLPPLSDRKEDIPPLAEYFLREAIAESGVAVRGFTTGAMARLVSYGWPGNVRELRNLIYRLAATVDSDLIGTEHLPSEMNETSAGALSSAMKKTPLDAAELKRVKTTLRRTMYTGLEKKFVIEALDRADWNVTRAAELVGMLRPNFHALMKKCGIKTKDNL